ncbi:MAG TPA: GNAT family N-acetyltransferase [Rhizomicrobium sp.]|jgi:predicted GNAT family acetyltransferase|nr:GNAT family N-acetyltransferase [Rhizomicrobium sp.]
MIDNSAENRFELEENGLMAWAEYRVRDGVYHITHVEAEPPLRGTGAAGRLMQQIVDHARASRFTVQPRCSYARIWFTRHADAQDVIE